MAEKLSRVAICERCGKMVKAAHKEYLTKESLKDFSKLSVEGFTVRSETLEETLSRDMGLYSQCSKGLCTERKKENTDGK